MSTKGTRAQLVSPRAQKQKSATIPLAKIKALSQPTLPDTRAIDWTKDSIDEVLDYNPVNRLYTVRTFKRRIREVTYNQLENIWALEKFKSK